MSAPPDPQLDPRFVAAVDLIGRTGAAEVQIRFCEEEEPTVWMVVATYDHPSGSKLHQVAAGMGPYQAAFRLAEQLVDGGKCTHCGKPTGVTDDFDPMPNVNGVAMCWYQWDPELRTFRRGCEGETPRPSRAQRRHPKR